MLFIQSSLIFLYWHAITNSCLQKKSKKKSFSFSCPLSHERMIFLIRNIMIITCNCFEKNTIQTNTAVCIPVNDTKLTIQLTFWGLQFSMNAEEPPCSKLMQIWKCSKIKVEKNKCHIHVRYKHVCKNTFFMQTSLIALIQWLLT